MTTIVIVNGYAENGEEMALYVDGELMATAEIDGSNDCPETLMDFMSEFGVGPKHCGITDIDVLDEEPDLITESRPNAECDDDITDEQAKKMQADGILDHNWFYVYPESLADIAHLIHELNE